MDKSGCQGDDRKWYASRTIYVHSYEKYSPQKSVTNSSESCKWTCENNTDICSAVVYNKDSYICSVYEESPTSNYDELKLDNAKEEGFVRVCNTEEEIGEYVSIFLMFVRREYFCYILMCLPTTIIYLNEFFHLTQAIK